MSNAKIRWEQTPDFFDGYLQGRSGIYYSYTIQSLGGGRFKLFDTDYNVPVSGRLKDRFKYRELREFDDLESAKAYAEKLEASKC